MPAIVFAFANQKGGVGKTTSAVNTSFALADKFPTLLIDLDPQGNASSSLGYPRQPQGGLYQPLINGTNAQENIIATRKKNLFLLPSEEDLAAIEIELAQTDNYLQRLNQALTPIKNSNQFTAIIIDCPPALGLLSMNALAASDQLIVTLQCEYLALEGLTQILSVIERLQKAGAAPNLGLGGILMTLFDVRTRLSRQVVEEVSQHFPKNLFKTLIPRSVRLSEAPSFGQSIFEYDKLSSGASAYKKFSRELIKRFDLSK